MSLYVTLAVLETIDPLFIVDIRQDERYCGGKAMPLNEVDEYLSQFRGKLIYVPPQNLNVWIRPINDSELEQLTKVHVRK